MRTAIDFSDPTSVDTIQDANFLPLPNLGYVERRSDRVQATMQPFHALACLRRAAAPWIFGVRDQSEWIRVRNHIEENGKSLHVTL